MFFLCGSMVFMFQEGNRTSKNELSMGGGGYSHNGFVFPCIPIGACCCLLHGSISVYFIVCYMGVIGGAKAWARSMRSLTKSLTSVHTCSVYT
jgi:hypothetical protein